MSDTSLRYASPGGRGALFAVVLGSGVAFLDQTVVNVALPAIEEGLETTLTGLQWTVDAYLLTLGALLLVGGSLGDRSGRRRVFVIGLVWFAVASAVCGLAPTIETLVLARAVQGMGAALLVPGSLALVRASFHPDDQGQAIGAWAGLAGVTAAAGPLLGGWLVQACSWRLVFLINLPLIALAIWAARRWLPESHDPTAAPRLDLAGAFTATIALAGIVFALIEGGTRGWTSPAVVAAASAGLVSGLACVRIESRSAHPMLPLDVFRSRAFTGANLTTLAVYFALGGATFLFVIHLQQVLGYSPIVAGASLTPLTLWMLLLSPSAGRLATRNGFRLPMSVGPLVAAAGLLLLARVTPGSSYVGGVLPGAVVLGLGLALTVAPLTSAVLASSEARHAGIASGVNNAVARIAGLLAVAMLPAVGDYARAMVAAAVVCALGGAIAWVSMPGRRAA